MMIRSVCSIVKLSISDVHLFALFSITAISMETIVVGSKVEAIQIVCILVLGDAVLRIRVKELTVAHGSVHGFQLGGIAWHKSKLIAHGLICVCQRKGFRMGRHF